MTEERTLILVKPDGVNQGHIGEVITRLERKGYQIEALKVTQATDAQLRQHYIDKVDKPFFPEIESYMHEGPIVALVASGTNVISVFRRMAGQTNPSQAAFGTIRGDFGRDWPDGLIRNVVHSSDSVESAEREIKIWFAELK
ncbi:nucleoside-diphosphate kinase [Weissella beninensis]|uniref:nucleoside-diphosphate kinase n=1 Tax=Periweissella beninensis TaxID=504936 RepID=A0ABT0VGM5_9LACO|nr:nucleoside-diphosphate kinase [Periweissella beninensis]MBM7544726.1 nucleoside-diphosphate kinase [Periweissella beninensis]MCM2436982.1 nucleoside-diphosphate kinase [Periweissella beninensis]